MKSAFILTGAMILLLGHTSTLAQTAISIENGKVFQNGKIIFYCTEEKTAEGNRYSVKNFAGATELIYTLSDITGGMTQVNATFPLWGIYFDVKLQQINVLTLLQDMVNAKVFEEGKINRSKLFEWFSMKKFIPKKIQPGSEQSSR